MKRLHQSNNVFRLSKDTDKTLLDTLAVIEQVLERKRKEHPDFEITFAIKVKEA